MIRTQVYLPKPLYQRIGDVARRDGKPRAQVIRELLDHALEATRPTESVGHALDRLVRLGQALHVRGPADLSVRLDDYLYDD